MSVVPAVAQRQFAVLTGFTRVVGRRHKEYRRRMPQATGFGLVLLPLPLVRKRDRGATAASTEQSNISSSLTGVWVRDDQASELDAYDRMLQIMQLSGLQRTTALRLIEGLELRDHGQGLSIQFLTVVPFFKVTEEVLFDEVVQQGRRDLRRGQQTARATRTPSGVCVEISWGDPLAGRLSEAYHVEEGTLRVQSRVTIGEATEKTTVVYRRNDRWRPRFSFPGG